MLKKILLASVLASFATIAAAESPPFEQVDTNNDGMLSQEEAMAVADLDFADADKNADGMLSPDEYEAATAE